MSELMNHRLTEHLPDPRIYRTPCGFLDEVYMVYRERKSESSAGPAEAEEVEEASLVLEIVRAQCDVHRAEKMLADCVTREHEKIANLHRFKAKWKQDSVHHLDLNIGWINATFNNHGRSQPGASLCTTLTQQTVDVDGTTQLVANGHLLAVKLD
ncbi:hypothetical protein SCLCIDRAFT_26007 [Scleroderma citrinum Foug A]|uniref:Uncharacterized protein n=1 Tax=Scleroderma citrinum Foug A TaxID=1036808 RepID=A0A0C2ZHT4_9AGAM|nr:hypothetical protein SCLCIDRAFT_26007 [Scleroderma citrinum Foug A]